jgi:hypothetical protein
MNKRYANLQINVPDDLALEVIEWGNKNIKDDDLYINVEQENYGREDEIHVSVLYGIYVNNSIWIKEALENEKSFNVRLGNISKFTNSFFDIIKIEVFSPELIRLNYRLERKIPNVLKLFPTYQPHITVAYVKRDAKLPKELKTFFGKNFMAKEVLYSREDGKSKFSLK